MRKFLDRLPSVLAAKPGPRTRGGGLSSDLVARLLEAILHHREMRMYYHSISSGRNKNYLVHPYRIAFAQGSLYLLAFVPEYEDMRTFAVDRIASASPEKQTFKPIQAVADDVFGNSLGVNTGPAKRVVIEFDSTIAPYVRARVWHPSQRMRERQDGSIVLTLHVCHDWALRSWILGWGSFAKVQAPPALAAQLLRDLSATATRYANEPGRKASHTTATLSHTQ
jgi:predicted DNA-binding transcriptional regulator YafY